MSHRRSLSREGERGRAKEKSGSWVKGRRGEGKREEEWEGRDEQGGRKIYWSENVKKSEPIGPSFFY